VARKWRFNLIISQKLKTSASNKKWLIYFMPTILPIALRKEGASSIAVVQTIYPVASKI